MYGLHQKNAKNIQNTTFVWVDLWKSSITVLMWLHGQMRPKWGSFGLNAIHCVWSGKIAEFHPPTVMHRVESSWFGAVFPQRRHDNWSVLRKEGMRPSMVRFRTEKFHNREWNVAGSPRMTMIPNTPPRQQRRSGFVKSISKFWSGPVSGP